MPVKLLVRADPKPEPVIVVTPGDRTIISGYADRPSATIGTQPFQAQARMSRILRECFKSLAGGIPDLRRQAVVHFPEICRAARGHFLLRRDLSLSARKFSGDCEYLASRSSSSKVSAGRGDLSFRMASQPSTGNSFGQS